jgi:hypothetical protein
MLGFFERTFQRRETAIEQQLEIAQLALAEEQSRQGLGLGRKLGMARQVSRDQVLEDAAVGRVGHRAGWWLLIEGYRSRA